MYSSGSEHAGWDYIPPKKLKTTLLSESPRYTEDVENSFNFDSQTQKIIPMVTPKDCTRANSPIHMSSVLFSDYDEPDEIRTLFEQLVLVRDRHSTLKNYVNSVRAQLQQSFNLAIAELQGKRNLLISQVDLLYDEHFSKLCSLHKEKEKKIEGKDDELASTLDEIENMIQKLEVCDDVDKMIQEVNRTIKVWVSENDVTGEWAELPAPDFNFTIVPVGEINKREEGRRNTPRCTKKHRGHRHEPCRSSSKNRSYENILRQNDDIKQRVNKLESFVGTSLKPPKPERFENFNENTKTRKKKEEIFDLGVSESPISISTLYTDESSIENIDGRMKIFVPHGYPAYSCFYLVKVAKDVTVSQVADKIALHIGMGKFKYVLKVKDAEKLKKIDPNEKAYHLVRYKVYLEKVNV